MCEIELCTWAVLILFSRPCCSSSGWLSGALGCYDVGWHLVARGVKLMRFSPGVLSYLCRLGISDHCDKRACDDEPWTENSRVPGGLLILKMQDTYTTSECFGYVRCTGLAAPSHSGVRKSARVSLLRDRFFSSNTHNRHIHSSPRRASYGVPCVKSGSVFYLHFCWLKTVLYPVITWRTGTHNHYSDFMSASWYLTATRLFVQQLLHTKSYDYMVLWVSG